MGGAARGECGRRRGALRRWVYPEFGAPRLKDAIATSIGRRPDEIVVGNGSGEVILAAVSVFAGGGALVLARPDLARERVGRVVDERERVARSLRSAGHEVAPSSANFLLFAPKGGDAAVVRERRRTRGGLVRDVTSAAPGRWRVSLGTPAENDLFLEALKEVS